jgi:hypothetical protein
MLRIQKVSIGSAFRIGAVVSAIGFVVMMLFSLLFIGVIGDVSSSYYDTYNYQSPDFGSGLLSLFCGAPFAAIFGGLAWALGAFIYNLAAGWVGGLDVEVEQWPGGPGHQIAISKQKRDDWRPVGYQDRDQDPYP